MPHFRPGDCLFVKNERVVIKKCIGSGNQADVYRVLNIDRHKEMAMKHLYGFYSTNSQLFYRKLAILSQYPAPHPSMVWPIMVSDFEINTGAFVYLMDLLPSDFKPIAVAMKSKNRNLLTDVQRLSLSKKLVEVFSTLHSKSFIYCDISGDNIYYRFDEHGNADVRIIDCDNVSMEGQSLGLLGTGLFRSPEVLLGKAPTKRSDAHALTVTIFRLLIGTHPLDGKYTRSVPFTPDSVLSNFGKNPQYIFSPNSTNGPISDKYNQRYLSLSSPLKLYFDVMFCNDCLHNSEKRPDLTMLYKILNM